MSITPETAEKAAPTPMLRFKIVKRGGCENLPDPGVEDIFAPDLQSALAAMQEKYHSLAPGWFPRQVAD